MIKVKDQPLKNYTFIDLFAGLGGFRLALESMGAKCIWSDEWDQHVAKIYQKNFGDYPHGDITKIPAYQIPSSDIVCAGFPCQAFSISGKKLGFKDTRGTLFFDVARIVKANQPKIVLMENVKNLVHHDHGKTFKVIQNTMRELGYNFFYRVLDAKDYNVPQNRKRVYMVCFRHDMHIKDFQFPKSIPLTRHVKDILQPINDIPNKLFKNRKVQWNQRRDDQYRDKPIRLGKVNQGRQGERVYSIRGTAITLSAYGGGLFAKTGGYKTPYGIRKLTPRECARLMGFPDSYKIDLRPAQAYKQFGNSVVVNVLQYICKQIGITLKNKRRS